jgi:hypothetical protein
LVGHPLMTRPAPQRLDDDPEGERRAWSEVHRVMRQAKAEPDGRKRRALFNKADALAAEFMGITAAALKAHRALGSVAAEVKQMAAENRAEADADIAHWRKTLHVEDPYLDGLEVAYCHAKDDLAVIENGGATGQYGTHIAVYKREIASRDAYLKTLREISLTAQFKPRTRRKR